MQKPSETIIFFDGFCNLCNSSVQFILKRDKKGIFTFCSLQADAAQPYLKSASEKIRSQDSMLLLKNGEFFSKSDAALEISKYLEFPWPLMNGLKIFPKKLRDFVYDFIAKNRYKWFGKQDFCLLFLPEWKSRFLE